MAIRLRCRVEGLDPLRLARALSEALGVEVALRPYGEGRVRGYDVYAVEGGEARLIGEVAVDELAG